jgi:hypothetical protein
VPQAAAEALALHRSPKCSYCTEDRIPWTEVPHHSVVQYPVRLFVAAEAAERVIAVELAVPMLCVCKPMKTNKNTGQYTDLLQKAAAKLAQAWDAGDCSIKPLVQKLYGNGLLSGTCTRATARWQSRLPETATLSIDLRVCDSGDCI